MYSTPLITLADTIYVHIFEGCNFYARFLQFYFQGSLILLSTLKLHNYMHWDCFKKFRGFNFHG